MRTNNLQQYRRLLAQLAGWAVVVMVALSGAPAGAYNAGANDLLTVSSLTVQDGSASKTMPGSGACGPNAAACVPPTLPLSNTDYSIPVTTSTAGSGTTIRASATVAAAGSNVSVKDVCGGNPSSCFSAAVIPTAGSLCTAAGPCVVSANGMQLAGTVFRVDLQLNPANFVGGGATSGWLLIGVTATDASPALSETEYYRVDYTSPASATPQICITDRPGENDRRSVEGGTTIRYFRSATSYLMSAKVKPNVGTPTPADPNLLGVEVLYGGSGGTLQQTYTGPYAAEANNCSGTPEAGWLNLQTSITLPANAETLVHTRARNSLNILSADQSGTPDPDDIRLVQDSSAPTFGSTFSVRDASNATALFSGIPLTASVTNPAAFVSIEGIFSDTSPGRVYSIAYDTTSQAVDAAPSTVVTGTSSTIFTGGTALSSANDFYRGWTVQITSGLLAGQTRVVQSYDGALRRFTMASGFGGTPGAGNTFVVTPMAGATTITIPASEMARLTEKAPVKVSDLIRFIDDPGQLNRAKRVRISAIGTNGTSTVLTILDTAADGTPVVFDPNASFTLRHTGFAPMRGVLTGCPGACLLSLPGGATTAEQKAWDQIFTSGAPDYGRGLGVNDVIMFQTGATGGNLNRRWKITAINAGARTVSLNSTAIDGAGALANDANATWFAYDAPSGSSAELVWVDGEDVKGGYLCNPCSNVPFRIGLNLAVGPNLITLHITDDAGRITSQQLTINYSTPSVSASAPTVNFTRMLVAPTLSAAQAFTGGQACTGPGCYEIEPGTVMGTGANTFSISAANNLTVAGGGVDFTALLQAGTAVRVGSTHVVVKSVTNATTAKVLRVSGTVPVGPLTGATRHRLVQPSTSRLLGNYEGVRIEGVAFTDDGLPPYDTTGLNPTPDLFINGVNVTSGNVTALVDPDLPAGQTRAFHFTYTVPAPQYSSILIGASPAVTLQASPVEYLIVNAALVTGPLVIPGGMKSGDYIQVPLLNGGNRVPVIGVLEQAIGGTFTCNGQALLVGRTCVRIPATTYAGGPGTTLTNIMRAVQDGIRSDNVRVVHDAAANPQPEVTVPFGYMTDRAAPQLVISGVSDGYTNVTVAPSISITDAHLNTDGDSNPSTGPTGFRLYQGVYVLMDPSNPSRTVAKMNYDFSNRVVPLPVPADQCYPATFFNHDTGPMQRAATVAAVSNVPASVFDGASSLVNEDNYYIGWQLRFTSGPASGQTRTVSQYSGANRRLIMDQPFSANPAVGNSFLLYSWDKVRSAETTVGVGSITTTQFNGTSNLSSSDNIYAGDEITFISGPLAGQAFTVTAYSMSPTPRRFTISPAASTVPLAGDQFMVRTRARNCRINPLSFPQLTGHQLSGYTLGDETEERGGYRMEVWAADLAVPPNVTATSAAPVSVNFGVVLTAGQATVNDFIGIFGNIDGNCPDDRFGNEQTLFSCFLDKIFTTLTENPTSVRGGHDVLGAFFDAFAFVLGSVGEADIGSQILTNPMALTALGGLQDIFPGLFSDGNPDSDIVTILNLIKNGIDRQIFRELPLITLDAMYDPDNNPLTQDGIESLTATFRTLLSLDGGRFRVEGGSSQDKSSSPFVRATPAFLDLLAFEDIRSTIDVINRLRIMDVEVVYSGQTATERRETIPLLYDVLEGIVDLYDSYFFVDSVNGNSAFIYDANANGIAPEAGEVVCANANYSSIVFKNSLNECYCGVTGAPAWCVDQTRIVIDQNSDSRSFGRALYILMNDQCAAVGGPSPACDAGITYKDPTLKGLRTVLHEILAIDPSTGVSDLTGMIEVVQCVLEPIDDGSSNVRDSPIARLIPTLAALVNQTGRRYAAECTLGGQILPVAITPLYASCTSPGATLRRVDGFRRMECRNNSTGRLEGIIRLGAGRAPADFCSSGELIFPDEDALGLLYPALEFITDENLLSQITRIILQFPDTDDLLNMLVTAHDLGLTKRIFPVVGQAFDQDNRGRRSQIPECGTPGTETLTAPACRLAGLPNVDVILDSMADLLTSAKAPFKSTGTCTRPGYPPRPAPCFERVHNTPMAGFLDTFDELFVKNPPSCCTCPKACTGTAGGCVNGWRAPTVTETNACVALRSKDFDPRRDLWQLMSDMLNNEMGQSERDAIMEALPTMAAWHTGANTPAGNVRANPRRFIPGPRDSYNRWFNSSGSTDDSASRPAGAAQRYYSTYWVESGNRTAGWAQQWPPDRAFPSPVMCANGLAWTSGSCSTSQPIPYPSAIPTAGDANYMHQHNLQGTVGIRSRGRNPYDQYLCDNLNCCDADSDPRCNRQDGTLVAGSANECGGSANVLTNSNDCNTKGKLTQQLPNPYIGCGTNLGSTYNASARWKVDVQGWSSAALPETPIDCWDSPDLLRGLDEAFRTTMGVDLGSQVPIIGNGDFLLSINKLISDISGFSNPPLMPSANLTNKIFGLTAPVDREQLKALFTSLYGARGVLTGSLSSMIRYDSEDFGSPAQTPECTGFIAADTGNRTLSVDTKLRLTGTIDRSRAIGPLIDNDAFPPLQRLLVKMVGTINPKEASGQEHLGLYQSKCNADCALNNCGSTQRLLWGQSPAVLASLSQIEVLGFGAPAIVSAFAALEEGPDREVLDGIFEILGDAREVSAANNPKLPQGMTGFDIIFSAIDNMISPADGSTVPFDGIPMTGARDKEPFLYPLFPAMYQMAGVKSRTNGVICNATAATNGCAALSATYQTRGYGQIFSSGAFNPVVTSVTGCSPDANGFCDPSVNADYVRITCTRDALTGGVCIIDQEDGTAFNMTFTPTDKRSHTGHLYRVIERLNNDRIVIDAVAVDDPGIIVAATQPRAVDFVLQTGQRTSVARALRAIGQGILNDLNQDPDIPAFDATDLDSIIADVLRCDTEGLLLDTVMYYIDSDPLNGDARRLRNAIFSLKPFPAIRDGMIDAVGNLLGSTGGQTYLGVEGRAPVAKLIPFLRDGAIKDPTEQFALQRSFDNTINPYNPKSNLRLNSQTAGCSPADASKCVAFIDPVLDIIGSLNATSSWWRTTSASPLAAECYSTVTARSYLPWDTNANNPCSTGGARDFNSMLKPFLGGAGLGGLDVRTANPDGSCTPAVTAPVWEPKPDGIIDECFGGGAAPGDGIADFISRWDKGVASHSLSRGVSDPHFSAGLSFQNLSGQPVQGSGITFYHSGRAGGAGSVVDRAARAHIVVYSSNPAGWTDTAMIGAGWTPNANFFAGINCDNALVHGLSACPGGSVFVAKRQMDFYVRPREGFQTIGVYPPVTVPAGGVAFVFIQQTGAEPIEIGLDASSYMAPTAQYPAGRTMHEVLQRQAANITGAVPPDHMDFVSTNGTAIRKVQTVMGGTAAIPMVRLGFGYPVTRPQEMTDFEKGLPVFKLLFNTPLQSTAANPQQLRPVEPLLDALLALLIPIDIKPNPTPGPNRVPADCSIATANTPEIDDYVYLPRLGETPYRLQTCQEAAVGLGCIDAANPTRTIGQLDPTSPYPAVECRASVRGMPPIDLDQGTDNATPFELMIPLIRRLMLTTYTDPDLFDGIAEDIVLFDTLPFFDLLVMTIPPLSQKEETMLGAGTMTTPIERIFQMAKVMTSASADPNQPYISFFPGYSGKLFCGHPSLNPIASATVGAGPPAPTTSAFVTTVPLPSTALDFYKGWSLKVLTGNALNIGQTRTVTGYAGGVLTVSPALPAAMAAGNTFSLTSNTCVESIDVFDFLSSVTRLRTRTDMTTGITTTEADLVRLIRSFSTAFFEEPKQPLKFTPRELPPRVIAATTETQIRVNDGYGAPAVPVACAEGATSVTGCNYLLDVTARKGQIPGVDSMGGAISGSAPLDNAVITLSRPSSPLQGVTNALHFAGYNNLGPAANGMLWYHLWQPGIMTTPVGGNRPGTDEQPAIGRTQYQIVAGDVLEYGILIPSTSHVRRAAVEIVFEGMQTNAVPWATPFGGQKDGGILTGDNCHTNAPTLPNTRVDPFDPNTRNRFARMSDRDRRCLQYLAMSYNGSTDLNGTRIDTNVDLSELAADKWLIRRIPLTRSGTSEVSHQGFWIRQEPNQPWSGVYFVFDGATHPVRGRAEAYVSFVRIVNGNDVKVNIYDGSSTLANGIELCDGTANNPTALANPTACHPTVAVWSGLNEANTISAAFPAVSAANYIRKGVDICPASGCVVGNDISIAGAMGRVIARSENRAEIMANNVNGRVIVPIRPSEMPFDAELDVQVRCGLTDFSVFTVGGTPMTVFTAQKLNETYYTSADLVNRTLTFNTGPNTGQTRTISAYTPATNTITVTPGLPSNSAPGHQFTINAICPLQSNPVVNDYMNRGGDSGPFTFTMRTGYAPRPWRWRNVTSTGQDRPVYRQPAIDDPAVVNNITIGEPSQDDALFLDMAMLDQFGNVFTEYRNPAAPATPTAQTIDAYYNILMPRLLKFQFSGWSAGGDISQTVLGTGENNSIGPYVWAPGDYLEYEIFYPMVEGNAAVANGVPAAPSVIVDMKSVRPDDGSKTLRTGAIFGMPPAPDPAYGFTMRSFSCTAGGTLTCTSPVIDHRTLDQYGVPAAPRIHYHTSRPVKDWGGTNIEPDPISNFYYRRIPVPDGIEIGAFDTGSTEPIARGSRVFLSAWRGTGAGHSPTTDVHSYIRNIQIGSGNTAKKQIWDSGRVMRISPSSCNNYTAARPAYCPHATQGLVMASSTGLMDGMRGLIYTAAEYDTLLTTPGGLSTALQTVFTTTVKGAPSALGTRLRVISSAANDPQLVMTSAIPASDFRNGVYIPMPDWNNQVNCPLGSTAGANANRSCTADTTAVFGGVQLYYQGVPNLTAATNSAVGAARFCPGGTYGVRCPGGSSFGQDVTVGGNPQIALKPNVLSAGRYRRVYTMSPAAGLHEVRVSVDTAGGSCTTGSCVSPQVENYAQLIAPFDWSVNALPPPAPAKMEFANDYAFNVIDLPNLGTTGTLVNDVLFTSRRPGIAGAGVTVVVNALPNGGTESVLVASSLVTVNVLWNRNRDFVIAMLNASAAAQDLLYAQAAPGSSNAQLLAASPGSAQSYGPVTVTNAGTVFGTNLTQVMVGSGPQRLQVRVFTQYDRPTINQGTIDPSNADNAVLFTARNAGEAGTGISVRVSNFRSDCTTPVSGITVLNKLVLIPATLTNGVSGANIVNLLNNDPDASSLIRASLKKPDLHGAGAGTGAGVWPVLSGCNAFEVVLSPVSASSGAGTGGNPTVPGTEATRRPWTQPIPVTFQVTQPKNAIRVRGYPQVAGAYMGLRLNAGIVRRPTVHYDTSLMASENDTLPEVCLCGGTGVCAAASCGTEENNENNDGDNVVVLHELAGYMPGDRIRILGFDPGAAPAQVAANGDFTARVAAVTPKPDSAAPGTLREWIELDDIKWLSEQCDMTSVADLNAVPGLVNCAGNAVDIRGLRFVWANPNTANDDKFCVVGSTAVDNACQYEYAHFVNNRGSFNATTQNNAWRLSCSSGNFERGADGVWHHVMLFTQSRCMSGCSGTSPTSVNERYRNCLRNNYNPAAAPDGGGAIPAAEDASGWWGISPGPADRVVDEAGFSTQVGAVRLNYADNSSGIFSPNNANVGRRLQYEYTIIGIFVTIVLTADYNLVPGFLNHELMIPKRIAGADEVKSGRMGIDFAAMPFNYSATNWFPGEGGWFPTTNPGNGNQQHVTHTVLVPFISAYTSSLWLEPHYKGIANQDGGSPEDPPIPINIDTSDIPANIRTTDLLTTEYGQGGMGTFALRVIGLPRRALWMGGYNRVHTRIVRCTSQVNTDLANQYQEVRPTGGAAIPCATANTDHLAGRHRVWSRTGLFLAMVEQSGNASGQNWREYYTRYVETNSVNEKMAIAAGVAGNPNPSSMPIYFKDVFYNGETVLPSHMVSNYSYYHTMGATGACSGNPPGGTHPTSPAACYSPNNPTNGSGLHAFHVDRIEISGARVKALSGDTFNAELLYPAHNTTVAKGRLLCSQEALRNPGGAPPQCAGGLSRPGGFATVRANVGASAPKDGTATADLYWPSFDGVSTEVRISAPSVPAVNYRRSVGCPATGCPP
ncbi:MAG: hypothetical protein KIT79_02880 [Deltaproteobacteria bacterium]|nr:hypothetical protein [Deltaproteobacteria bacterium]